MMNEMPDVRRQAWRLFLRTHAQLLDRLEHEMQERTSLPLNWYDVLARLRDAPNHEMRLQDLGRSVLLSKSGLTRRIDRMMEAGLVTRRGCKTDRRGAYAVLTPQGMAALQEAMPVHLDGVRAHFLDRLSEGEGHVLVQVFDRILETLEGDCAGTFEEAAAGD